MCMLCSKLHFWNAPVSVFIVITRHSHHRTALNVCVMRVWMCGTHVPSLWKISLSVPLVIATWTFCLRATVNSIILMHICWGTCARISPGFTHGISFKNCKTHTCSNLPCNGHLSYLTAYLFTGCGMRCLLPGFLSSTVRLEVGV